MGRSTGRLIHRQQSNFFTCRARVGGLSPTSFPKQLHHNFDPSYPLIVKLLLIGPCWPLCCLSGPGGTCPRMCVAFMLLRLPRKDVSGR